MLTPAQESDILRAHTDKTHIKHMRTKTTILTAALVAAGALTSMAQVYSVNEVGYINLAIPTGFSLIANQLNNQPDNTYKTLFPTATTANNTVLYKFDNVIGAFGSEQISGGVWSGGGNTTLNPGEGAFIFTSVAFTATFVGEVQTGTSTVVQPVGFAIVSSVIPQQGRVYDVGAPGDGQIDLGNGIPSAGQVWYQFDNALGAYGANQYSGGWSAEPGPLLKVGESAFVFTSGTGGAHNWTRTFNVGP